MRCLQNPRGLRAGSPAVYLALPTKPARWSGGIASRVPDAELASRPFYGGLSGALSSGGSPELRAAYKTRAVFVPDRQPCTWR